MDDDLPIDVLENTRGRTPRNHINDEAVGREIERRFRKFLRTFKDDLESNKIKYIQAIKQMVADNRESLEIDYDDLSKGDQNIVYFLPEVPTQILERLNKATTAVVYGIRINFVNYFLTI